MKVDDLSRTWNALGEKDPFWAVLTGPDGEPRQWDLEAFFASGAAEISTVMQRLSDLAIAPRRDRALDFGCGPGRLTQALAASFAEVDGVDIAESMIRRANALNQQPGRCRFHLNERPDLALFEDDAFDLVYSNIVLQHVPEELATRYISEFIRVARRGAAIVFQLPARPLAAPAPVRTRCTAPLPRSACNARISLETDAISCGPGTRLPIVVRIENISNHLWPALPDDDGRYAIHVGNHWRNRFGWMKQRDDVRADLPHDVAPGEAFEVGMWATAPTQPGRYRLEVDLVQEMVRWFARAGSETASISVDVRADMPAGQHRGFPPKMEMHGVAREEVEALLEPACEVVAVDPDESPGPAWESYRYFAVKR